MPAPGPILLIEDNEDDVLLTRRALGKAGVTADVHIAHDGVEALERLRADLPPPALVLLDLKLPRLSGLEVLERLRADARTRYLRVVVLTSSREPADVAEAYRLGADSYVRKPVDYESFVDAVAQLGRYWLQLNEPPPQG